MVCQRFYAKFKKQLKKKEIKLYKNKNDVVIQHLVIFSPLIKLYKGVLILVGEVARGSLTIDFINSYP